MRISLIAFAMNLMMVFSSIGFVVLAFICAEFYYKVRIKSALSSETGIHKGVVFREADKRCIDFTVNDSTYRACSIFNHKESLASDTLRVECYFYLNDPELNFLDLKEDAYLAREALTFVLPLLAFAGIFLPYIIKTIWKMISTKLD
ncbi:MAG: hypothetical protein AAGC88_09285 [Bacteroidota bacterium]